MQLSHELPDYAFTLRSADGRHARVNDLTLTDSFILSPQQLVENWPVRDSAALTADDLAPLLALQPEVVLLGTGERQVFPPAAVMAACLRQGVGLEVMTNAAAARTFNVLAGESRRVVAGFLLAPDPVTGARTPRAATGGERRCTSVAPRRRSGRTARRRSHRAGRG